MKGKGKGKVTTEKWKHDVKGKGMASGKKKVMESKDEANNEEEGGEDAGSDSPYINSSKDMLDNGIEYEDEDDNECEACACAHQENTLKGSMHWLTRMRSSTRFKISS